MTVHRLGSLGVLRDNSFVMFGMFLPLSYVLLFLVFSAGL